jgi:hypothetical protein
MDVVNTAISNIKITKDLQEEINYFMIQMHGTQEE